MSTANEPDLKRLYDDNPDLKGLDPEVIAHEREITRRKLMGAGMAVGAGALIAACGGSSSSSSSGGGSTGASTGSGTGTSGGGSAPASGVGADLTKILGSPKNLLSKGPGKFKTVGQFALTGQGAIYGVTQTAGWKYGTQHVKEWTNGKLDMTGTTFYDNKSGVPAAEAAAGRQAGLAKVPVFINDYIFGFGAVIPYAKQFKMFCPDAGGGQGPIPGPWAGADYCYGFRAAYPTDPLSGIFKYLATKFPSKTKWVTVQPVIAPPYNNAVKAVTDGLFKLYPKVKNMGEVQAPLGATDYSSTVQKIKALNPDVVVWSNFGTDAGYCAKEMKAQGVNCINASVDFTQPALKIAAGAMNGWYHGFDYLNVKEPPNDWSKFFVKNWLADNGNKPPDFYNAGYYVTAFVVAALMDRILGAGGDINSGDDYVKQLEANPSFPHVYGGSGSNLGKIVIDPKTHSPSAITMQMFLSNSSSFTDVTPVAEYNIGAKGFKMLKS